MRRIIVAFALLGTSCGTSTEGSPQAVDDAVATDTATTAPDTTATTEDTTVLPDEGSPSDALLADASDVMGPPVYGPYPAGPYGNKVGDVLPDLKWQGFVNATSDAQSDTKPFVSTSLDALRRTARKPYALIHVSEYF